MLSKLYDVITSTGNVVHVALATKKGQGTRFRSVHVQWVVLCIDNFLDMRVWVKKELGWEGGVERLVGEQERGQIKRARMYIYYFNVDIK